MTLYLPGFHLQTLRRRPRSALKKLADKKARIKQHSITQLGECFSHFIPVQELDNHTSGQFSRRRLFSKTNIFWAFFSQVLDADSGCQEAVRKVQAFAAAKSLPQPSSSTSAYCQARQKNSGRYFEAHELAVIIYSIRASVDRPRPSWNKALSYSKEEWSRLPKHLTLRQIKVSVETPGFRVKSFYLITTLLDPAEYSANALSDLYRQRWDVELFFRDIKTTMDMDVLRCRDPEMVRKEILMHFIAYNAIRRMMGRAAKKVGLLPRQISFKASIQALRQWEPRLSQPA